MSDYLPHKFKVTFRYLYVSHLEYFEYQYIT